MVVAREFVRLFGGLQRGVRRSSSLAMDNRPELIVRVMNKRGPGRGTSAAVPVLLFGLLLGLLSLSSAVDGCFPGGRLIRRMPKREPPLVYKQHIPNVQELSPLASGPRESRIRRSDKRFKELVTNLNPDIVFRDNEGTGEDRIMSRRCEEKLNMLAVLVMNYWPGVKLRVTAAWVEEHFLLRDSLHFEGRAVDITTSDRDRNKNGMLARLAVQAGFDWVHYESRLHIHASVKSDTVTRHKRVLRCFPGDSTVVTSTGSRKSLCAVQAGDRVQAMASNGSIVFSPVILFLHREVSTPGDFYRITTSHGRSLTVSSHHLLYKFDPARRAVYAREVALGDQIMARQAGSDGLSSAFSEQKVTRVESVTSFGAYAPLTDVGTIVVDDVVVSCYASTRYETLAHAAMALARWWNRLFGEYQAQLPFGSGFSLGSSDEPIHWYPRLLMAFADAIGGIWTIVDCS